MLFKTLDTPELTPESLDITRNKNMRRVVEELLKAGQSSEEDRAAKEATLCFDCYRKSS
jgi:hypothetical protein